MSKRTTERLVSRSTKRPPRRRIATLASILLAALLVTAQPASAFGDVPAGAFYEEPVDWLVALGITTGTSPTTFSPNDPVTRGQMAAFLWRYAGEPSGHDHDFSDVSSSAYYDAAVGYLAASDITTGVAPNSYGPDQFVTRGQMAAFLYRFAGSPGTSAHSFSDVSGGAFYSDAVGWLAATGITTGVGPGRYGPDEHVTRGQMAAFLYRLRTRVPPGSPPPAVVYLDELDRVAGTWSQTGSLATDGDIYAHSMVRSDCFGNQGPFVFEYDLGRDYTTFASVIGISDRSDRWESQVEIFVDGVPRYSERVGVGAPIEPVVDVSGALRLRFLITTLDGGNCGGQPYGLVFAAPHVSTDALTNADASRAAIQPSTPEPFVYLNTLDPIGGNWTDSGVLSVDGDTYAHSLARSDCFGNQGPFRIEYDLSRDYSTFSTVIGISDASDVWESEVKLLVDGEEKYRGVVTVGVRDDTTLDVTGALRLTVMISTFDGGNCGGKPYGLVLADPQLTADP